MRYHGSGYVLACGPVPVGPMSYAVHYVSWMQVPSSSSGVAHAALGVNTSTSGSCFVYMYLSNYPAAVP